MDASFPAYFACFGDGSKSGRKPTFRTVPKVGISKVYHDLEESANKVPKLMFQDLYFFVFIHYNRI